MTIVIGNELEQERSPYFCTGNAPEFEHRFILDLDECVHCGIPKEDYAIAYRNDNHFQYNTGQVIQAAKNRFKERKAMRAKAEAKREWFGKHHSNPVPTKPAGFKTFGYEIPEGHLTDQVGEILERYLPEAVRLFASKNAAYQAGSNNGADRFGVAGQFMKLADKVDKLERPLWIDHGTGPELEHEEVMEVLQDMFGHVMLTMLKYDQVRREM